MTHKCKYLPQVDMFKLVGSGFSQLGVEMLSCRSKRLVSYQSFFCQADTMITAAEGAEEAEVAAPKTRRWSSRRCSGR